MIINACDMSNGGSKVAGESKVLLTGLIYRAWQIVKGMAVFQYCSPVKRSDFLLFLWETKVVCLPSPASSRTEEGKHVNCLKKPVKCAWCHL